MYRENNIQFPAEWAPQSGVMLTWPHAHSDWQALLLQVEPVFIELAYQISQQEQVLISCWNEAHKQHVSSCLTQRGVPAERVNIYTVASNDTWARDHGPISIIKHGKPAMLNFIFNGWGNKYQAQLDNTITPQLCSLGAFADTSLETIDLVMEGGSLETDGQGTLLTTSRCLLSPQRNPSLDRPQLEHRLNQLLGVQRFLWLEHGHLVGDDTDSHIDTLARFCSPDTICYVSCNNFRDEHYNALQAMAEELKTFKQVNGEPYKLVPLPMTQPIYNEDGVRLPSTYANFLIINNAVLMPTYEDVHDSEALQRLKECFPDREIIAINCRPLIEQYGSLHCVTMQLPQGVLNEQADT